ncbi:Integral membrane protein OS=Streptomyces alboniger OX=132473 GN=CP975_18265 PE=4 SV=1 [Streptomyces alboniger]
MAHAAPLHHVPASRSTATSAWALPVLLGLVYGFWAATTRIHGGPVTAGKVLLGVVSGLVLAVLAMTLHQVGRKLPCGPRALSWAVLAGVALGFLYSQSGRSVLACAVVGLVATAGVFAMTYYRYSTARP